MSPGQRLQSNSLLCNLSPFSLHDSHTQDMQRNGILSPKLFASPLVEFASICHGLFKLQLRLRLRRRYLLLTLVLAQMAPSVYSIWCHQDTRGPVGGSIRAKKGAISEQTSSSRSRPVVLIRICAPPVASFTGRASRVCCKSTNFYQFCRRSSIKMAELLSRRSADMIVESKETLANGAN